MNIWKMKFHRRSKQRKLSLQKSSRTSDDAKERSIAESTTGIKLASCIKKAYYVTDDSISVGKKSDSDSTGVSKGTSTLDYVSDRTTSTGGSKKVRFDVVEIRHYERIASDNPCCSSGPPIGIGWNHGETQTSKINDYERIRGNRKFYLDIALTRREREQLLVEWGVDTRTILASIRAAMKTKFQRKQTVINARKFSKVEEAIETTSERIKNILLKKRQVDEGEKSAAITSLENFESDFSNAGETISISTAEDIKSNIHVTEPDEDMVEKMMKGKFEEYNADNENAANSDEFSLGATTLGVTSTYSPSIIEIEKFYDQLELELFGDDDLLPSMLGQTLEFPQEATRKNRDRNNVSVRDVVIQNEISFEATSRAEPDTENLSIRPTRDQSQNAYYHDYSPSDTHDRPYMYDSPETSSRYEFDQYHSMETHYDRGASQPLEVGCDVSHPIAVNLCREYNDSNRYHSFSPYTPIQKQTTPSFENGLDQHLTQYHHGCFEDIHSQRYNPNQYRRQRIGSFDSYCNIAPAGNSTHVNRLQQHPHSYHLPQYLPSAHSPTAGYNSSRCIDSNDNHSQRSSLSLRRDSNFDGPLVRHMPLQGHLSADQLIEGTDREGLYCNECSTVTITEGGCEETENFYRV